MYLSSSDTMWKFELILTLWINIFIEFVMVMAVTILLNMSSFETISLLN